FVSASDLESATSNLPTRSSNSQRRVSLAMTWKRRCRLMIRARCSEPISQTSTSPSTAGKQSVRRMQIGRDSAPPQPTAAALYFSCGRSTALRCPDKGVPMLELRPTCENCNEPLPPESLEARICTFECTFCARCVEEVLANVCPNCGGGFCPRPVRPSRHWKGDNYLR